jgi:hypothetical protein
MAEGCHSLYTMHRPITLRFERCNMENSPPSEAFILLKLDIIYQTLNPNYYSKRIYIVTS